LVSDLWEDITPEFATRIGEALKKSAFLKVKDARPGWCCGRCLGDSIEFEHDGTLNDPVYMAHESGHFMACLTTLDKEDLNLQPNFFYAGKGL
jgi:hypothetical protein